MPNRAQKQERLIAEIEEVVSRWKDVFASAVTAKTGIEISEPSKLSYAQILMGREGFKLTDALNVVSGNIDKIGGFRLGLEKFLHTPGYEFATQIARQIYAQYRDERAFKSIVRQKLPLIAIPHNDWEATPVGTIFHQAGGIYMSEMFYQAGADAQQVQIPDVFYTGPFGTFFVSIKAIPRLKDNPVLGKYIEEHGLEI